MAALFWRKRKDPVTGLVGVTGALDRALVNMLSKLDVDRSQINPFEVSFFSMSVISGAYSIHASGSLAMNASIVDEFVRSMSGHLLKSYGDFYGDSHYDDERILTTYHDRYKVYGGLIPSALSPDDEHGTITLFLMLYKNAVSNSEMPPMMKLTLYQVALLECVLEAIRMVKSRV